VTGRWWRRNWWGLLALVPALALAFYAPVKDARDQYWLSKPHEPVSAAADGWVSYAGARMRLVALVPATDVKDFSGKPVSLAGGAQIWRATIAFKAPDPTKIDGCELALESSDGATFEANPSELTRADVHYASCAPDTSAKPGLEYQAVAYFVVPRTTRPVAVWVILATKLPRYAWLTPS